MQIPVNVANVCTRLEMPLMKVVYSIVAFGCINSSLINKNTIASNIKSTIATIYKFCFVRV